MPIELRRATPSDLEELNRLDSVVFGESDLGLEPAAAEEFEKGLQSGGVFVTVEDDDMLGFVHMEPIGDDSRFLASLAVHPDHRRTGIGRDLLEQALSEADHDDLPVSTVTGPENLGMIRLLLDHGFVATDYIDDYYGHGKSRIVLNRAHDRLIRTTVERRLVPVVGIDTMRSQLRSDGWVIQALQSVAGRDYFQFAKVEVRDREEFKADEFHAGMAFSGTVLAALIFLLGFSIDSSNFYDDIRILLAVAVTASLISMVVYANTGGDLARLESDRFVPHMETGNILSEYGGIVPLLVIVPVAVMAVVNTDLARTSLGLSGTVVLITYFLSTFSLWTRYERRWWSWIFASVIAAAPVSWLLITGHYIPSVLWTIGVVSALLGAAVDLFLRSGESSPPQAFGVDGGSMWPMATPKS